MSFYDIDEELTYEESIFKDKEKTCYKCNGYFTDLDIPKCSKKDFKEIPHSKYPNDVTYTLHEKPEWCPLKK